MESNYLTRIALVTVLILLIPFILMLTTNSMNWGIFDFIIVGVLIFGAGLAYTAITRKGVDRKYRIAVGLAVFTGLLLMWTNLAVGLIGSEDNPANLMYFGVLAIGIIGAALARLEAQGMSRTLFITAFAQMLVPIIALLIWQPPFTVGVLQVLGINAFFALLWVGSGVLFRRSKN